MAFPKSALALACALMLATAAVAQTLPTVADVKDTVMGAADTAMGAVEGAAGAVSGAVSGAVDDVTSAVEDVKGGKEHTWDTLLDLISTKNNTSIIEQAVEVAAESGLINDLAAALNDTTTVATVFLPRDEELGADMAAVESLLADPAMLADVLKNHVVLGNAYTLDQLTDGMKLQTLLDGPAGELTVVKTANMTKPALLTSSGQKVAIYQYKLKAGAAEAFTIKGLLMPGDGAAAAPAPAAAA